MIKKHEKLKNASLSEEIYHHLVYGGLHHVFMGCTLVYILLMCVNGDMLGASFYEALKPSFSNLFLGIMAGEFLAKLVLNPRHLLSKAWSYIEFGLLVLAYTVPGVLIIFIFRFFVYVYTFFDHPVINRAIHTFLHSLPTLIMSSTVLGGCMFGYGLLANTLFGKDFPELFGSISQSLFTFLQLMTFDDWMAYILRPVMELYPFAWVIFLSFILLIVFGVLNIFIGTIVNSMSAVSGQSDDDDAAIKDLKRDVSGLKDLIIRQCGDIPKK